MRKSSQQLLNILMSFHRQAYPPLHSPMERSKELTDRQRMMIRASCAIQIGQMASSAYRRGIDGFPTIYDEFNERRKRVDIIMDQIEEVLALPTTKKLNGKENN